jgi:hypothetical protein
MAVFELFLCGFLVLVLSVCLVIFLWLSVDELSLKKEWDNAAKIYSKKRNPCLLVSYWIRCKNIIKDKWPCLSFSYVDF